MWLKLTLNDGSPIRLNSDLVEAYQPDGEGTILSTNDGGYSVKESLEEIDDKLMPREHPTVEKAKVAIEQAFSGNWK